MRDPSGIPAIPKLTPPLHKDKRIYAHSPDAPEGDLYNKESFFPIDDFLRSSLINEELSGSMAFYYGKFDAIDSLACGNLRLRKRRLEENAAANCL